jgi:hypothetical protein
MEKLACLDVSLRKTCVKEERKIDEYNKTRFWHSKTILLSILGKICLIKLINILDTKKNKNLDIKIQIDFGQ